MSKVPFVSLFLSTMLALQLPAAAQNARDQEAFAIARDAYVYAYPLVLTYLTAVPTTNYAEPTGIPTQAPVNQFSHARELVPTSYKVVVRPNNDTLYSTAVVDVGPEPIVLSLPATDRYFMLPMMSLWTDIFAVPGSRTTGRNTAREFLIVGPKWSGTAPGGLDIIRSPTRLFDIVGRTQIAGPAEYETVHKIQAGYRLTPLSAWGKGEYVPPKGKINPAIDMKTPAPVQIDRMDAKSFFRLFAELLVDNPPGPFDYPIVHRLERIGFKAGEPFDLTSKPPEVQQAFEEAVSEGKSLVARLGKEAGGEGGQVGFTQPGAAPTGLTMRIARRSLSAAWVRTCHRMRFIRQYRWMPMASRWTAPTTTFFVSSPGNSPPSTGSGLSPLTTRTATSFLTKSIAMRLEIEAI